MDATKIEHLNTSIANYFVNKQCLGQAMGFLRFGVPFTRQVIRDKIQRLFDVVMTLILGEVV